MVNRYSKVAQALKERRYIEAERQAIVLLRGNPWVVQGWLLLGESLLQQGYRAAADEVFICSTLELAVPVTEISGRPIGKGVPGPISKKLGQLLVEAMSKEAALWHSGELKKPPAEAKGGQK